MVKLKEIKKLAYSTFQDAYSNIVLLDDYGYLIDVPIAYKGSFSDTWWIATRNSKVDIVEGCYKNLEDCREAFKEQCWKKKIHFIETRFK